MTKKRMNVGTPGHIDHGTPQSVSDLKDNVMLHPCKCTSYNGQQCYNCLNGAHDICGGTPKCKQKRDKVLGLPIVVI